jgi:hypothetical protein
MVYVFIASFVSFFYVYVHISDTNQQTAAAAFSSMAKAKEYITRTKKFSCFLLNIFYTHFTIASTTGTAKIYAHTKSGTKNVYSSLVYLNP